MPNHHGGGHHHRSSHHRKNYYLPYNKQAGSNSRESKQNPSSDLGPSSGSRQSQDNSALTSEWTEHRSSSGKIYYYNVNTGVSQWEIPKELKSQQCSSPPLSDVSETSSMRQKGSPNSNHLCCSPQNDSSQDEKPLISPALSQYYKPELVTNLETDDSEVLANSLAKEASAIKDMIIQESVGMKISKSHLRFAEIRQAAHAKRCHWTQRTIEELSSTTL